MAKVHVSPLSLGPPWTLNSFEFYQVLSGQSTGRPCDTSFLWSPVGPKLFVSCHGGPLDPSGVMGPRWHKMQIFRLLL